MSRPGFRVSRLRVVGPDVETAEVKFAVGLNVISGPSDTGKTYVLQCIDFALGAKDPPKSFREAEGYDRVLLAITPWGSRSTFTIERSLRGGDVLLHEGEPDPFKPKESARKLKSKHDAKKDDNLSAFLLALCDLSGKRLRSNARGDTKSLSFRNLARLTIIDETTIIAERSPIHSGRPTDKTPESAIFRLLLTGVDDSSLVASADPKLERVRRAGRSEVLEDLAIQAQTEIERLALDLDRAGVADRIGEIDADLAVLRQGLLGEKAQIGEVERLRRSTWQETRKLESRVTVLRELSVRFDLLGEHYASDQARLESIGEAAGRIGELHKDRCPLCGALAEHHDHGAEQPDLSPADVEQACRAETEKITSLQSDLASTLESTNAEVASLREQRTEKSVELAKLETEIRERLAPRVEEALERFNAVQADRDRLLHAASLYERLEQFEVLTAEATQPVARPEALPSASLGADETENFSKQVEAVLKAWHFPELGRVTFSEKDQDIVINGSRRASHGKGVRAVTHASFVLGLLRYAEKEARPHPGFVVIDSPLVVYRAPDDDESMPNEVKEAFFRGAARQFKKRQVVILENEERVSDFLCMRQTGSGGGMSCLEVERECVVLGGVFLLVMNSGRV
ncbi:MAG: AAA family ATPase, partial [Nannocystaceae bacterium]